MAMKNRNFRPISRFVSEMIQDKRSYYGMRIGNRNQGFEWYRFQLSLLKSCVTSNANVKVTILFNVI